MTRLQSIKMNLQEELRDRFAANTVKNTISQINGVKRVLDIPDSHETYEWLTDKESLEFVVDFYEDVPFNTRLQVYVCLLRVAKLIHGETPDDDRVKGMYLLRKHAEPRYYSTLLSD